MEDAEKLDVEQMQGEESLDTVEDSMWDPVQKDPDCISEEECWSPPTSTLSTESEQQIPIDASCAYGGDDPDDDDDDDDMMMCHPIQVDKHWGKDPTVLKMRDTLRTAGRGESKRYSNQTASNTGNAPHPNERPPIILIPGLASTRLVAWKHKVCSNPFLSDIKVSDIVWLNLNLIMQMVGTIDVSCVIECLKLGWNQTDADDANIGCKLRPDEGLDAISSLSPGTGIPTKLLVGGTNTVYAWLVQWLADNLGYDVTHLIGLPYDWRLSPDKLQSRDGFLTHMRRKIEAAVQFSGKPSIVVAHSMGNAIFRYFLDWLHAQLQSETHQKLLRQYQKRRQQQVQNKVTPSKTTPSSTGGYAGWAARKVDEFLNQRNPDASKSARQDFGASCEESEQFLEVEKEEKQLEQLWELAQLEGTLKYHDWLERHVWTYVGLSAPMLGAVNPLRAVLSGENMGVPWEDADARKMEITFGSTHTVNPISSQTGFCDHHHFEAWDEQDEHVADIRTRSDWRRLACLDDIATEIDASKTLKDPWENFPALKALMINRVDWNTDFPMVGAVQEYCEVKEKSPCLRNRTFELGPMDVQNGNIFDVFDRIWREDGHPLKVKKEQLAESFWSNAKIPNMLNSTWERPLIKHVIMAYGVDVPTEIAYVYRKRESHNYVETDEVDEENRVDPVPEIQTAIWEEPGGVHSRERFDMGRGAFGDMLGKKKRRRAREGNGRFQYSGDGSVPYLSLVWVQTWLLHAVRALRHDSDDASTGNNPLAMIDISHRPKGGSEWTKGPPPALVQTERKVEESSDTGTTHPHGTRYKPEMTRFHSGGKSRTSGIEYTTTVIEAVGVEHKETTR